MREWEEQMRNPQVCYVLLNTSSRGQAKVAEHIRESPGMRLRLLENVPAYCSMSSEETLTTMF